MPSFISLLLYFAKSYLLLNLKPNDLDSYVHRVGRTGRAGKKGTAVSFFVSEKNGRLARDLVAILNRTSQNIPNELQALASFSSGRGGRGRGRGRGQY